MRFAGHLASLSVICAVLGAHGEGRDRRIPHELVILQNRLPAKPALHYSFDQDNDGVVLDCSGRKHNARIYNAKWTEDGKHNGAIEFSGDWRAIRLSDDAVCNFTKNFTICCWIKPFDLERRQGIVVRIASTNDKQYALTLSKDGLLTFDYERKMNNWFLSAISGDLKLKKWNHVAVTVSRRLKVTLYIDGKIVASGTAPRETVRKRNRLTIGSMGGGYKSSGFRGVIDEVLVFRKALSRKAVQKVLELTSRGE